MCFERKALETKHEKIAPSLPKDDIPVSLGNCAVCSQLFKAVGSAMVQLLVPELEQHPQPGFGGEEAALPSSRSVQCSELVAS